MKNREIETWHILIFMTIVSFTIYVIYGRPQITYTETNKVCKEDSLKLVIKELESINNDLLESKIIEEDGWDSKEKRYEDILFDYQMGLDHLKNYHPEAYREFHRIVGHRERYTTELERDNNKRLSPNKNISKW
jgi:hypothetical protein